MKLKMITILIAVVLLVFSCSEPEEQDSTQPQNDNTRSSTSQDNILPISFNEFVYANNQLTITIEREGSSTVEIEASLALYYDDAPVDITNFSTELTRNINIRKLDINSVIDKVEIKDTYVDGKKYSLSKKFDVKYEPTQTYHTVVFDIFTTNFSQTNIVDGEIEDFTKTEIVVTNSTTNTVLDDLYEQGITVESIIYSNFGTIDIPTNNNYLTSIDNITNYIYLTNKSIVNITNSQTKGITNRINTESTNVLSTNVTVNTNFVIQTNNNNIYYVNTISTNNTFSYQIETTEYTTHVYDDKYHTNKNYVGVGLNGYVITSSDGSNWIELTIGDNNINDIVNVIDKNVFLAVCDNGYVMVTYNGLDWLSLNIGTYDLTKIIKVNEVFYIRNQTSPEKLFKIDLEDLNNVEGYTNFITINSTVQSSKLFYANGNYIAVNNNNIYYSTSLSDINYSQKTILGNWNKIIYSQEHDRYFLIGDNGSIAHFVNFNYEPIKYNINNANNFSDILVNDNRIVVIDNNKSYYTDNGLHTSQWASEVIDQNINFKRMSYFNNKFHIYDDNGNSGESSNGQDWDIIQNSTVSFHSDFRKMIVGYQYSTKLTIIE